VEGFCFLLTNFPFIEYLQSYSIELLDTTVTLQFYFHSVSVRQTDGCFI